VKLTSELITIYEMVFRKTAGHSQKERLENFYSNQAAYYDDFRKTLLRGRQELYKKIQIPDQGIWIEMGGGTAANLEFLGEHIYRLKKVYVVDLSPSLLQIARERIQRNRWSHVELVEADMTTFQPKEKADVITFSYSLSMVQKWFEAIDHGLSLLKNEGQIGVVDFYISPKYQASGLTQHNWWTRHFWPMWFGFDNVTLHSYAFEYLLAKTKTEWLAEQTTTMPYIPMLGSVPYFQFVGRKSV
jgi:S-adenosylmethionine-diacylgycerolhomoserine-N-methlytransferase